MCVEMGQLWCKKQRSPIPNNADANNELETTAIQEACGFVGTKGIAVLINRMAANYPRTPIIRVICDPCTKLRDKCFFEFIRWDFINARFSDDGSACSAITAHKGKKVVFRAAYGPESAEEKWDAVDFAMRCYDMATAGEPSPKRELLDAIFDKYGTSKFYLVGIHNLGRKNGTLLYQRGVRVVRMMTMDAFMEREF